MNHTSLFASLALGAITLGSLHSLAPDHWVPIAAVARARGWSRARTARVALICGFGHVTVSVLLGLLALLFGAQLFESLGEHMVSIAGLLLIGFGVAYAIWGLRGAFAHRIHGHHHHHYDHVHDPSRATTWSLFLIYCADPCVAVIPILFAAAPLSLAETLSIVVAYEVATIGTMVVLVALAHSGAQRFKGKWIERYGDSAAGALIVATGVMVAILDW
ncbi:MAG: sulfite exporter TauE/SafE family protein [Myxococcales bacterium]